MGIEAHRGTELGDRFGCAVQTGQRRAQKIVSERIVGSQQDRPFEQRQGFGQLLLL